MQKVFLYLYPIWEFHKGFTFSDEYYQEKGISKPFPILNDTIHKRYRDQGYQVIFVMYPDKEVFGIDIKPEDKIIYADIPFTEATSINGTNNPNMLPKYPNEEHLLSQLGHIDNLVIGGYHFSDCVKRVAEKAESFGIDTLVDLDMTELFFILYQKNDYFEQNNYDPKRYIDMVISEAKEFDDNNEYLDIVRRNLRKMFSSSVYGFDFEDFKESIVLEYCNEKQ